MADQFLGRRPAVVGNTERAMAMLLDDEDDPGVPASDPGAEGHREGYVLMNGQRDAYPDTVPLAEAPRIAHHLLESGAPPAGVQWVTDR